MDFKREKIEPIMLAWLYQNFPISKNYLVRQDFSEQINSYLRQRLVAPFQSGRKHNLWGATAATLPQLGKQLGWVPNKIPAIFLSTTVEHEIADAGAAAENKLQPDDQHFEIARKLLNQFGIHHLAQHNPFYLSQGETKILWFITQWLKKPRYLIIGHLPSGLSEHNIHTILNFMMNQKPALDQSPTIILGYQPDQADWCARLFTETAWQSLAAWPD